MSDPFLSEIRMVGFNFAPNGWATCDGQLLPISQATALFSLLGTNFGGDGRSTFALPNLQGSVPIGAGGNQPGPGLSIYNIGDIGGVEQVSLDPTTIPSHTHTPLAASGVANSPSPQGHALAAAGAGRSAANAFAPGASATVAFSSLDAVGGAQPHNNMQPYMSLYFVIALQGIFPQRQ